jgi:hypothetical protein
MQWFRVLASGVSISPAEALSLAASSRLQVEKSEISLTNDVIGTNTDCIPSRSSIHIQRPGNGPLGIGKEARDCLRVRPDPDTRNS